jgi:hypothetical protein
VVLVVPKSVPTNKDAQVNVPPPEIAQAVLKPVVVLQEFKTTPLVTVKVKVEFTVSALEVADVPRKVKDLQVASRFTVTVIPELIVTSSKLVGTAAPPQVAVEFQFPVTDAVRVAALTLPILLNKATNKTIIAKRVLTDASTVKFKKRFIFSEFK